MPKFLLCFVLLWSGWGKEIRAQAQGTAAPPAEQVAFYLVAHQDDWQLFMGSDAYRDAQKTGRRVVFIFVTAGQAGNTGNLYWQGREAGALAAMQAVVDQNGAPQAAPVATTITVSNRRIAAYRYGNATSYFLRLPDGNLDGTGFERTGYHSLRRLRAGTDTLTSLEPTATYRSWSELVGTLRQLVRQEAGGSPVVIHCPEADSRLNPGDHSDHRMVGRLGTEVATGQECRVVRYVGYDITNRAPNLTPQEAEHQRMVFAVTCRGLVAAGLGSEWNEQHLHLLGRQYAQIQHHANTLAATLTAAVTTPTSVRVDSATTVPAPVVQLEPAYPNPFTASSLLRYTLPLAADVRLSVYTMQGVLVRTLVQTRQKAGCYEVWLDVEQLPAAGQYVCYLQAGTERRQCRIELIP